MTQANSRCTYIFSVDYVKPLPRIEEAELHLIVSPEHEAEASEELQCLYAGINGKDSSNL